MVSGSTPKKGTNTPSPRLGWISAAIAAASPLRKRHQQVLEGGSVTGTMRKPNRARG